MQAIALGSNSVLYFQWRKSRGSSEKFHGAVVDHDASEKNRVFQEVAWIGKDLEKLSSQILSTCNRAKVAIIMDWENWWALSDAQAISRKFDYTEELLKYYRVFEVDIISMDRELSDYQLVVAPTLYLHKKEYIHKVEAYVEAGGIYVTTYWSGVVNETDLCFIGERPHERLLGLSVDEIDVGNEYFPNTFSLSFFTVSISFHRCSLPHQWRSLSAVRSVHHPGRHSRSHKCLPNETALS